MFNALAIMVVWIVLTWVIGYVGAKLSGEIHPEDDAFLLGILMEMMLCVIGFIGYCFYHVYSLLT